VLLPMFERGLTTAGDHPPISGPTVSWIDRALSVWGVSALRLLEINFPETVERKWR
jgi:hypothetical protein